jgi:hypothetical protein
LQGKDNFPRQPDQADTAITSPPLSGVFIGYNPAHFFFPPILLCGVQWGNEIPTRIPDHPVASYHTFLQTIPKSPGTYRFRSAIDYNHVYFDHSSHHRNG